MSDSVRLSTVNGTMRDRRNNSAMGDIFDINENDMRKELLDQNLQGAKLDLYMKNPTGFSVKTKRKNLIQMLKHANQGRSVEEFRELAAQLEHDPALMFSAEGRLQRWMNEPTKVKEKKPVCCGAKNTPHEKDLLFVKKLEKYESRLHDDLEVRRRAINNWKKLRILLILLSICGGKLNDEDEEGNGKASYVFENDKKKTKSCKESIAPYIISPFNKKKILWDTIIGLVYLLSYFVDPYVCCFFGRPLEHNGLDNLQLSLTFIFVFDMLFNFVTGAPREDNTIAIDDDDDETATDDQKKKNKNKKEEKKLKAIERRKVTHTKLSVNNNK